MGSAEVSDPSSQDGYRATRYPPDARRARVWSHVAQYLQQWVDEAGATLELGAGDGDFSNHIRSRRRVAIDAHPALLDGADDDVEVIVADATDLERFATGEFATVFASNFVEHLEHPEIERLLSGTRRVLDSGGRLILVQPNFRVAPRRYFDDYTHRTIWTDRSLVDLVASHGFRVVHTEPRFLPLTMRSRWSNGHRLVPLYLRLPGARRLGYRPLAGQMLVVAERP